MNLILHQAMTDIRAQRWLVAAWAAMFAGACAIEALKIEASMVYPLLALSLGRVVLGWVLAIRIVHADPLDSTSAFWLTRPLSPRMLLAAKAGLISGLLLVVPAVAALVVFIVNGVAIATLPGILGQWLLIEALPLLPIVLVATLTRDVARMVLTLLVSVVFWSGLQYYCLFWSMVPLEFRAVPEWFWTVGRAWLVVGAGVVALSATLIARQYLTRRTASIAFAALVAALGITAIAALWPMRLVFEYAKAEGWEEAQTASATSAWTGAAGISVTIPGGTLRTWTQTFPNARSNLVGDLRVDGLEQAVIVAVERGRGTLSFPKEGDAFEGRNVMALGSYVGPVGMVDEASRRNFERVIGARLGGSALLVWGNGLHLIGLEKGVYEKHQVSPAVYEGDLVLDAYRVIATAAMPLKVGASGRTGGVQTTILAIRRESRRWVIDLREAAPRVVLPGESARTVRIVRNRRRGDSLVPWGTNRRVPPSALASTAVIAGRTAAVLERPPQYGGPIDEAWLNDAELVLVSFERLGRFTKHVTIPSFVLPPAR
jgi:hypothetical protein